MGKIDDMRRLREQQFADASLRQAKAAKAQEVDVKPVRPAAPVDTDREPLAPPRPAPAVAAKKSSSKDGGSVEAQGKCPDCGKMKPLSNGLLANHQKGFGKACPGARKKPV